MENLGLSLIFWYGVLHAFGPDHLTAIADFSIGKEKKRTILITLLFAIGHGITLFIFAKILESFEISDDVLAYGDYISSSVIFAIGLYLLYMVATDKIHLNRHSHDGKEHIHIYFGTQHSHNNIDKTSAFSMGVLMGAGGVRGMLITLGAIEGHHIDYSMVLAFTLGVMVIFIGFGVVILYINQTLLTSQQNVRRIFTTAGIISLIVGANIFLG